MKIAEKKIAAALAAVELYLQEEAAAASAGVLCASPSIAPLSEPSAWSQSGRMDMMGLRKMVQLRAFAVRH